jgi:hypothetical protein
MTPARTRELVAQTGLDRRELARLLGYGSENSLRQCETGKARLPADKAAWLETFARFMARWHAGKDRWLENNPPPGRENDEA